VKQVKDRSGIQSWTYSKQQLCRVEIQGSTQYLSHQLSHRQVKVAKYEVELCMDRRSLAKVSNSSTGSAWEKMCWFKGISQSSNEVRLKMWFFGADHLMCVYVE
jgi:hypothetical protein